MTETGIYHGYLQNGDYYQSDGTQIQSSTSEITDVAPLTQIFDGAANNPAKQYVWRRMLTAILSSRLPNTSQRALAAVMGITVCGGRGGTARSGSLVAK